MLLSKSRLVYPIGSSLFRSSSFFPSFTFRSINEPKLYETKDNYIVKVLLPDAIKDDFKYSIDKEKNLTINWKDLKQIQHYGRVYSSSENHTENLQLPDYVKEDSVNVKLDDDYVEISFNKPPIEKKDVQTSSSKKIRDIIPKKSTQDDILPYKDNILMKMKLPKGENDDLSVQVKDDKLYVDFKTSTKDEKDGNSFTSYNQIQKMISIPKDIDPSNIKSDIVNNELIISKKDHIQQKE